MAKAVLMPQAGISVESCIITEWLKKPGDSVVVGDILFAYETDKASFECESTEAGTLLEAFFQDGDEVPVLTNVCAVGAPGDDVSGLRPDGAQAAPAPEAQAPASQAGAAPAQPVAAPAPTASGAAAGGALKISPRARSFAEKQNVDVRLAEGTGPYGRIIERDVRKALDTAGVSTAAAVQGVAGAAPGSFAGTGIGGRIATADLSSPRAVLSAAAGDGPEYEDISFTGIRKAISKSMTASLRDIPQLTHNFSFDATELFRYRKALKANDNPEIAGITLGDMILFAVSRLLPARPELNAHMLDGTTMRRFRDVHLGFACDTDRGLMVPVVHYANRKSLREISLEVKALAAEAQTGKISPDKMSGGSFTVSNLGVFGVESFTPVINPPQTGILGVDNVIQRPREVGGEIKLYPAMGLSMTYDHRAIDGAPLSEFVQKLCRSLEQFTALLAE